MNDTRIDRIQRLSKPVVSDLTSRKSGDITFNSFVIIIISAKTTQLNNKPLNFILLFTSFYYFESMLEGLSKSVLIFNKA